MIDFPVMDDGLESLVARRGEDGFRLYLEELRWPGGPECPRCTSGSLLWLERRRKYHCRECRYQFRVTAGTLFHNAHVPLRTWLVALSLILSSERGFPATDLQRVIGGSYKTAWFVEHRIRAALGSTPHHFGPGLHALRQLIAGPYRNPSTKYLPAYWNEARWRAAHRENPHVFRDTVLELLHHPPLPYEQLLGGTT